MGAVNMEEDVRRLADKFNNLVRNTKMTKAKNKQFWLDYLYIDLLIDVCGLTGKVDLEQIPMYDFFQRYLPARYEHSIHEVREVIEPAINTFIDAGFFSPGIPGKSNLSYDDACDIIWDFLDYFAPKSMPFFEELNTKGDFKVAPVLLKTYSCDGLAFLMPNIDEYRLFIADEHLRSVELINSLIHEFIHLYCIKEIDHNWKTLFNYKHGYFLEAPTILSELVLYDFLCKHGYEKDAILVRNSCDYVNMRSLKDVIFLSEMMKKGNEVNLHTDPITVTGEDLSCDLYDGIKGFEYPKNKNKTDNCYLEYCLSSLEAYQLLEQIKSGDKPEKVLDGFLRHMRHEDGFRNTITEDYNYGFLRHELEDEMKVLKKHYSRYKAYKEAKR